jgi:SAM-dependent methyltransferase
MMQASKSMAAAALEAAPADTAVTPERVAAHAAMLRERVFQTRTKWPQFELMLADMQAMTDALPAGARVVAMERTLLYGGLSLFAPLFHRQDFVSLDCSPESAAARGGYNAAMVDDPRCIRIATTRRAPPDRTGCATGEADLVMVPNLVHHVRDQQGLFREVARILKPGGRGYIFEPLVRELHQAPDDYLRYTPWGFQAQIEAARLAFDRFVPTGGPFTTIAYCWVQALEYFPAAQRAEMERWFYDTHFPQLAAWDEQHPQNLARQHTSFPTAYSVFFHKPQ